MSTVLPIRGVDPKLAGNVRLCCDCGRLSRDQQATCWRCGERELAPISTIGQIFSYTTVHTGKDSFVLALVELLGGKLVTARIVDADQQLEIGTPVEFDPARSLQAVSGGIFFSPIPTDA